MFPAIENLMLFVIILRKDIPLLYVYIARYLAKHLLLLEAQNYY